MRPFCLSLLALDDINLFRVVPTTKENKNKNLKLNLSKYEEHIPKEIVQKDINVPKAPNSIIVMKLRKNCFFLTWNLG